MGHQCKLELGPLKDLKASLIRKHLRTAVTKAGRPILQDAKREADKVKRYGFLKKSLAMKVRTYFDTGTVTAIFGARTDKVFARGVFTRGKRKGQTKNMMPSKYLHFLEGGTKRAKPKPILGPTFERNSEAFKARVVKEFWASVAK